MPRPCRFLAFSAFLFGVIHTAPAAAQSSTVAVESGLGIVRFTLPEGTVTAYLPDDVGPGERFSGTVEGPAGFVLSLGGERVRTGRTFAWRAPAGNADQRLTLVVRDPAGRERAQASLQLADPQFREPAFRIPSLIQAARVFPIRGPFDGDLRTTRVDVAGRPTIAVAESIRKIVVRAPSNQIGPAPCTLVESRRRASRTVRSISIDVAAADPAPQHAITIVGLHGVGHDVPLQIGGDFFYIRASEISTDGAFAVTRTIRGEAGRVPASLVIPQSRRDEVSIVMRTPLRTANVSLRQQRGDDLRALDFDGVAAAAELLGDFELGSAAAEAMLAADETRALTHIFGSMPQSGLPTQMLGFTWYLEHQESSRPAAAAALDAARRALSRVLSTAAAELALYIVGITGSEDDFPLLRRFYSTRRDGADGPLHAASEASLVRLGSQPHMDTLRTALARPVERGISYEQAGRIARMLRTAGLSGRKELIPGVCTHLGDPIARDVEYIIDPARNAVAALSALVDGTSPAAANASRRSRDEWASYCRDTMQ